ncbi:MAG: hypothetical protein MZV64_69000 [Ignavibacteriales bacterium]|nr:hypothetical protein [Ignavibacteriales bacterium]
MKIYTNGILALLNNKILPKKYMDEIFKGRVDARNSQYGYGWFIDTISIDEQKLVVYNHGGGINGFNTINYIVPQKGQVVILFFQCWRCATQRYDRCYY